MIFKQKHHRIRVVVAFVFLWLSPSHTAISADKLNVLFIAVDDLNDWVGCMGGHPQAKTPNIDGLAGRGTLFLNAHCTAPLCNPSRASVMSGLLPTTSGVHGNQQDWRQAPLIKARPTLPQYFKQHGYWTGACGKIYHANHGGECGALNGGHGGLRGFNHPPSWTERHPWMDRQLAKPAVMPGQNMNGMDIWHWDWGPIDVPDEATTDGQSVEWAVEQLQKGRDQPFFLAVGIYKPHGPWYVPRRYFEQFPVEDVVLPTVKQDDLLDVPGIAKGYVRNRAANLHQRILDNGLYHEAVQAYLANIAFADAMVGKILNALDSSPHAENTIVCLWSDHGWHLGEKQKWHKSTNWEEATRVPLIFVVPDVTAAGSKTIRPASLVDLYPTLVELCGLPRRGDLDGTSLVAQLNDPDSPRTGPAITTNAGRHHSVRNEQWRYIRYSDGSEELYDHHADPNEWTNLSHQPTYDAIKKELAACIPKKVNVVKFTNEAPLEDGFRPLFNGYDLTGWNGDPQFWQIKDGVIVGRTTADQSMRQNTSLVWRGGTVEDFELRLSFRISGEQGSAKSGVQYRSGRIVEHGPWTLSGYRAVIDLSPRATGTLYDENGRAVIASVGKKVEPSPAVESLEPGTTPTRSERGSVGFVSEVDAIAKSIRAGDWNDLTIIARANHLIHRVNGLVAVDVTDNDTASRAHSGQLGLLLHRGEAMTVEFKDIRFREL